MTELEVVELLQELKGAGLANEPKDPEATVKIWLDFFGGDDFRIIGKAVGLHLKKSHFWPTPGDIEDLKIRAQYLIDMEDEKREKLTGLSVILSGLHALGLEGEPEDMESELREWLKWFNAYDIKKVNIAAAKYIELFDIWPKPETILKLMPITISISERGAVLGNYIKPTNKKLNKQSHTPPTAPALLIKPTPDTGTFCDICELCDIRDQAHCPCDF